MTLKVSDDKMKKREMIKQRNKLKVTSNFKLWKYARIMFIFVPLIFLLYTFLTIGTPSSDYQKIIVENPAIIAGFATCLANLFMWYVMGKLMFYLEEKTHLETVRFYLILMCISQLALLNYISLAFLILGLYRYYSWEQFSIKTMFKEMKKDHTITNACISIFIIAFCICIELLFINLK